MANQALASTLDGGAGHDTLYGSAHADVLRGGAGDDVIYSGGGADRYVFDAAGWGHDVIGGWQAGQKLDFTGGGLVFADLSLQAGNGFIQLQHGSDTVQVYGAVSLAAGDFLFG